MTTTTTTTTRIIIIIIIILHNKKQILKEIKSKYKESGNYKFGVWYIESH